MILITGGTGFIGKVLTSNLLERYQIRLLTRDPEPVKLMFPEAEVVKGDILNFESLENACKDVDIAIHLAGLVSYSKSKKELFKINYEGTLNMLKACKNVKRFIFSSSVGILGPVKDIADEETEPNPITPYAESKLAAEKAVLENGGVSLRLAPVYGEGSPLWLNILRMLEKGFPVPKTESFTHILHVMDAAKAFELAIERGEGVYLIADKEPIKFLELVKEICNLLGTKPRIWPEPIVKAIAKIMRKSTYLKVLTMPRHYNIAKARMELGFEPKADLELELERMIIWYKGMKFAFE